MLQSIFDLKKQQGAALTAAEAILTAADQRGTGMTTAESENYDAKMAEYESLSRSIVAREKVNTIRSVFRNGRPMVEPGEAPIGLMGSVSVPPSLAETRSPQYMASLVSFLRTGGKAHSEELTAGADGQGGYYIPGSEAYTRQRLPNGSYPGGKSAATYEGTQGSSDAAGGYAISVPTEQLIVPLGLSR
jgi:hypothetical protein